MDSTRTATMETEVFNIFPSQRSGGHGYTSMHRAPRVASGLMCSGWHAIGDPRQRGAASRNPLSAVRRIVGSVSQSRQQHVGLAMVDGESRSSGTNASGPRLDY